MEVFVVLLIVLVDWKSWEGRLEGLGSKSAIFEAYTEW